MANKQTILVEFWRNESHHLLDRLANALAAKAATVEQARRWARKAKRTKAALDAACGGATVTSMTWVQSPTLEPKEPINLPNVQGVDDPKPQQNGGE